MTATTSNLEVNDLVPGTTYEFTYRQQSGNYRWYRWTMSATFIARQTSGYGPEVILSGRPDFGTTHLRIRDIESVTTTSQVRHPRRFPGAVEAPA